MSGSLLQSLVNGQQANQISIHDRGFQYGDGCFETIRVLANKPILWSSHLNRLKKACVALRLPVDISLVEEEVSLLLKNNTAADILLKITITRGVGGRGYGPTEQASCGRVLQLVSYVAPNVSRGARVSICNHRLSSNLYLGGIKHLNRLDQVLASAEIPSDCDEGLCLDHNDGLIEGCRSNLLLVIDDKLLTPDLSRSGVQGVMLNHLIEEFAIQGTSVMQKSLDLGQLQSASEVILCNSVFGVWPVLEIQDIHWHCSSGAQPYTALAQQFTKQAFRSFSP